MEQARCGETLSGSSHIFNTLPHQNVDSITLDNYIFGNIKGKSMIVKCPEIPFIIQKMEKPLFIGEDPCGNQFRCENCDNLLIDKYNESQFISVGIQCFRCSHRNITPTLEAGEVFSRHIVNLGETGNYIITDSIIARSGSAMTCSHAISEASKLTHPRSEGVQWHLTEESLDELGREPINL